MPTINARALSNSTGAVLADVERTGRPAIVTVRGRPVAALVPLSDEALEDWVLASAPEFVANMAEAEAEMAAGVRGRPLADVLAELDGPAAARRQRAARTTIKRTGRSPAPQPTTAPLRAAASKRAAISGAARRAAATSERSASGASKRSASSGAATSKRSAARGAR